MTIVMQQMQALVITNAEGPSAAGLQTVPCPEPAAGEVRIRLKAAALNRRDVWISRGLYPGITFPCIPGSDGAGIIDALGPDITQWQCGDEVIIYPARSWGDDPRAYGPDFRVLGMPDQGTFAEYICVPADNLRQRPAHLDWHQAAAVPLAGLTAWRAVVTQAGIASGMQVLVTGIGGGVAGFAMQWALSLGAKVFVSSASSEKISQAISNGATDGTDYRVSGAYRELARRCGGFDVIIDSAGGDVMNELLSTLKPAGRFVFYGATARNPQSGLELPRLFFRHISLQGTTMGTPDEFTDMLNHLERNHIVPIIDSIYPFGEVVSAMEHMESCAHSGKLVLTIP